MDDKSYLAYALNCAAHLHLLGGRIDQVRVCAAEALVAASAMRRRNEVIAARAMLARAGEMDPAQDIESLVTAALDRDSLSARVRSTLLESADRVGDSNGGFHGKRAI